MPDAKTVVQAKYDDVRSHLDRVEKGDEEPTSEELNAAIGGLGQMSAQKLYTTVEEHVDGGEKLAADANDAMGEIAADHYGDVTIAKPGSKELDTALGKLRKALDAQERKDLAAIDKLDKAGADLDRLGDRMS